MSERKADYTTGQPAISEYEAQCNIFEWAARQECKYPDLHYLFSTLNGVRLTPGTAMKAKRAGLKRGPLDLWLPARRGDYAGLVIELKVGKNKPTPEQVEWIDYLNSQGFLACAEWGDEKAIETITRYLEVRS